MPRGAWRRCEYWPEKKKIRIDVWSVQDPLAPEIDEAVRMPKLKLSWTLVAIDADTVEATYQVHADPGGSLPSWIVNLVSKEIPFKTISNLRQQVKKDGYDENRRLIEVAFDWDSWR